jgi:3-methyladenine DNA glycosylase AlkD
MKQSTVRKFNINAGKNSLPGLTAAALIKKLKTYQSDIELKKMQRYFKTGEGQYGAGDKFIGVRMGTIFKVAKDFTEMPASELEKLLESPIHEIRVSAVKIMDILARRKKTPEPKLKEIYELYMRRHDRINNWDLVDLACMHMTGKYLFDKPRKVLYKLAKSKNMWERRTAIVSTTYFIRQGDIEDTFKLSELLLGDKEDLVHKGSGWMLRYAGSKNPKALYAFLDKHAAIMPRTMLRYSIEKFDKKHRERYMNMKNYSTANNNLK